MNAPPLPRPPLAVPVALLLVLGLVVLGAVLAPRARAEDAPPSPEEKSLRRALEIEDELIAGIEKVRRATVSVLQLRRVKKQGPEAALSPPVLAGVGSGVIVSQKGTWVVTNVHVVKGADEVEVVTFDGRRHPMKVVDTIDKYDIALLGFPGPVPKGIKGVPVKPATGLEEGAWVLATGNPFFLAVDGHSVATLGVVSGLDRILGGEFLYGKAIQHDAEVNPGNSGGPLWNLRGDLIGINGMIASQPSEGSGPHNTGASFSIPSEQVARYLSAMIDVKTDAAAGDLGIQFETFVEKDGSPGGAIVTSANAAIQKADGLQKGDVITRVVPRGQTGSVIRTASDLTNMLSLLPAGTSVKVSYRRGKKMAYWSGSLGKQ